MQNMPMQPIKNHRFIPNRIVIKLLESSLIDLNDIAIMSFTDEERCQFAQLIGYSLLGFGDLDYVSNEAYDTAERIANTELSEDQVRIEILQETLKNIRAGLKAAAIIAFKIHPDDLVS